MEQLRGTLICLDPIILYVGSYTSYPEKNALIELAAELKDQKIIILMLMAWSIEEYPDASVKWRNNYLSEYPNHDLIYLTNTEYERILLEKLGAKAQLANHNIFVDENLYKPIENIQNKYDAVYNGQFLEFKRHSLAGKINKLAIIGYNNNTPYATDIRNELLNANFCNYNQDKSNEWTWLNEIKVNEIYNESRVGLCLSRREGAMHASIEYLLSGLPIVNTCNLGGRDLFFQGDYVIWVDDDSDAVNTAVEKLMYLNLERNFIRNKTLEKIAFHRNNFFKFIYRLCEEDSFKYTNMKKVWDKNY